METDEQKQNLPTPNLNFAISTSLVDCLQTFNHAQWRLFIYIGILALSHPPAGFTLVQTQPYDPHHDVFIPTTISNESRPDMHFQQKHLGYRETQGDGECRISDRSCSKFPITVFLGFDEYLAQKSYQALRHKKTLWTFSIWSDDVGSATYQNLDLEFLNQRYSSTGSRSGVSGARGMNFKSKLCFEQSPELILRAPAASELLLTSHRIYSHLGSRHPRQRWDCAVAGPGPEGRKSFLRFAHQSVCLE